MAFVAYMFLGILILIFLVVAIIVIGTGKNDARKRVLHHSKRARKIPILTINDKLYDSHTDKIQFESEASEVTKYLL